MRSSAAPQRKIIVNLATSADGYLARPDGDLDWPTDRPAAKDFYGLAEAIDEFIVSILPTFIGEGIPLLARRHREVPLREVGVRQFPDSVVQLHYEVQRQGF